MKHLRAFVSPWLMGANGVGHHARLRLLARPPFELPLGLRDEHRQTIDRQAACRPRIAHQRRLAVAIREVVDKTPVERSAGQRRLAARGRTAKRRAIDEQIPRPRRRWPRPRVCSHSSSHVSCLFAAPRVNRDARAAREERHRDGACRTARTHDCRTRTLQRCGIHGVERIEEALDVGVGHFPSVTGSPKRVRRANGARHAVGMCGRAKRGYALRVDYVNLGNTGLRVSRVCLGMMSYGKHPEREWAIYENAAEPIVRRAVEGGITFFDTADVYNGGQSEVATGKLLKKLFGMREEYVVATKVRGKTMPGENGSGLSRKHILASIDASLKRLDLNYVDLYQIHRWDDRTPIAETMDALHDVVKAGKARYIGASSMFAWQFAKAQSVATTRFV